MTRQEEYEKRLLAVEVLLNVHARGVPKNRIAQALGYAEHEVINQWMNGKHIPKYSTAVIILATDWGDVILGWKQEELDRRRALARINDLVADGFTRNDIARWAGLDNSVICHAVAKQRITLKAARTILATPGAPTYGLGAVRQMLLEEYPHMLAYYGDEEQAVLRLADAYGAYGANPAQVAGWLSQNGHSIDVKKIHAWKYQRRYEKESA